MILLHKLNIAYYVYCGIRCAVKTVALVVVILFSAAQGYGQDNTALKGKVFIDDKVPAESSTVFLLASDSSIVTSTASDAQGAYNFVVSKGVYFILASRIGYNQSISGPYTVAAQGDTNVADILLLKSTPVLKEVSISARKSYVNAKPGRVVLNVQNSIIAEGVNVYDLLRQAPGVQAGSQGTLSIIGRQSAMLLVDGKPLNVSGEALVAMLEGMQSSNVQQIELITNPSARYEAGGAGVINIMLKKGSNAGTNGTFTIGSGYGKYYKAYTGVSFNNRMGKVNIFGNYNYAANKTFKTFNTDRVIDYLGTRSNYDSKYYTTREGFNHSFKLGSDFFLSDNHTLGFLVSGTFNSSNYVKDNTLHIANNQRFDSTIVTMANLKRDLATVNYEINYTGKLDTLGQTISAYASYNHFDRESNEYISNSFYKASGDTYRPVLWQQNLSPSKINIWAAKVDYVKPLSKITQLETGLKYSRVASGNDLIFGPKRNGVYTVDPNFSSNFDYTENINSAYANMLTSAGKWKITAGLRVEQTNAHGSSTMDKINFDKHYVNLFPQTLLQYNYNAKNYFTLSFNRSIYRPQYEDINPFLYYVDLYDYRAGNPQLLPSYTNTVELGHSYNGTIATSLYASVTENFHGFNAYEQDNESRVNITTKKNFGRMAAYGIKFSTPIQFASWWNASFSADISYQRIQAYAENGDLNKGTQDILLYTNHSIKIGGGFSAEVMAKYESPTFYGVSYFRTNYRVDPGISKTVFNGLGTFKLNAIDIFRSERDYATTNYRNLNMVIVSREEGRVVRFGFTYRFGNRQLKNARTLKLANEDEQRRTGSVAGSSN